MWQELIKSALLGTENSALPEQTQQALEAQGVDTSRETPLVLADGIALYAQKRKAAFPLAEFSGTWSAPLFLEPEQQCPAAVSRIFESLLEKRYTSLLPEFFQLLKANNLFMPAGQLPEVLALIPPEVFIPKNKEILGAGARWLLAQHPDWQKYLPDVSTFDWQTGTKEERLALLQHLRKTNPDEARALLESTWQQESALEKAAFLATMYEGLSLADEPFLERALDDKRKEVREEAAKNLAKIPGSALSERMKNRTFQCFEKNQNGWTIHLPEEPDETVQRDGIQKLLPRWKGGTKASYLGQLAARTPLEAWTDLLKMSPEKVLEFFSNTDWREPLLEGIYEASLFHSNQNWMEACLTFQLQQPLNRGSMSAFFLETMSAKISEGAFNQIAVQLILANNGLPEFDNMANLLLGAAQKPWSDELTLLIIHRFHEALGQTTQPDWRQLPWKVFPQWAARYANSALLEQLQQHPSADTPAWKMWQQPYEEMLEILAFRREMSAVFTAYKEE